MLESIESTGGTNKRMNHERMPGAVEYSGYRFLLQRLKQDGQLGWEWNEDKYIYIYMEIHLRSPMLTPRNCFRAAGLAPESAAFAMALRRCAAHFTSLHNQS